jgi:tRNA(Arg) A34 adenosine deaminase TadA
MTTEQIHFMKRACELASISVEKKGGPFGCVITDSENYILAEGHNCVTETNDPTAHAEIVTIRKACSILQNHHLDGCILYTSCEPCPMCLSAIYWSRIKYVYYCNTRNDAKRIGFDDEYIYEELKKDIENREIQLVKVNIDESLHAFDAWLNKKDKSLY